MRTDLGGVVWGKIRPGKTGEAPNRSLGDELYLKEVLDTSEFNDGGGGEGILPVWATVEGGKNKIHKKPIV